MKRKSPDRIKANGIHYTPPELARFLADVTVRQLSADSEYIHVLDPACGNGALLHAFAAAVSPQTRKRLVLTGYEMDSTALGSARQSLNECGVANVILEAADFLGIEGISHTAQRQLRFTTDPGEPLGTFDAVIANPPYVRTQILGSKAAQGLAQQFNLSGRVDLYHAFARAMANVLRSNGVLGLLTSNRFFTTKAGETLRRMLRREFDLRSVYDLGDTKLFSAAVLPAIVIALKRPVTQENNDECVFARVYEDRSSVTSTLPEWPHVLEALDNETVTGVVRTPSGEFLIERGKLPVMSNEGATWSLSTPAYDTWLATVRTHQACSFEDVASVRVGLKTTADEVFVRPDWDDLAPDERPEPELLHPLITHYDVERWRLSWAAKRRTVLYPYDIQNDRKQPVNLREYPRTSAYFLRHEARLKRRSYVVAAGRQWYEIWVPQIPSEWSKPKIVFPDISEGPKFCLDRSGAIVQGDCYWLTLKEGIDAKWLLVILAVANSTFITKYYDLAFHNKLYSGRRRFMTQYVKTFPLPHLSAYPVRQLIELTGELVNGQCALESECDRLVWEAFGLSHERTA